MTASTGAGSRNKSNARRKIFSPPPANSPRAKPKLRSPICCLKSDAGKVFPRVVTWTLLDARRVTLVPPGHWLLIEDSAPFRADVANSKTGTGPNPPIHVQSIPAGKSHVACFCPARNGGGSGIDFGALRRRFAKNFRRNSFSRARTAHPSTSILNLQTLVLLTNGIGGMARLCVDLGRVNSKYDCALGANLNPTVPVDRHVFVKRIRVWVNADGFLSPLDFKNLASFQRRFARRLEFYRQRRRRPHGGNRIARRNGRRQKHDGFSFQPSDGKTRARKTIARRRRRAPDRARGHRRPEFSLRNQTQRRRGFSFLIQHAGNSKFKIQNSKLRRL